MTTAVEQDVLLLEINRHWKGLTAVHLEMLVFFFFFKNILHFFQIYTHTHTHFKFPAYYTHSYQLYISQCTCNFISRIVSYRASDLLDTLFPVYQWKATYLCGRLFSTQQC